MARGHRGRLDDRARDPREGSRRAVHHGRRDHLVGGRARDRGRGRAAPPRRAGSGLQHRLPAADQPGLRADGRPGGRVRGREDAQRARHVARCRAGVLPRPAGRARRPRAAGGAHDDRDPVHGVHGHRDDGERVLPALPRRGARPRARAGAPDAAPRRRAPRARRPRVRDSRADGGDRRRRCSWRRSCSPCSRDGASAGRSRASAGCTGSWPAAAVAILVLQIASGGLLGAYSAVRRPLVRRRRRASRTCGGTSPSSRSTSS